LLMYTILMKVFMVVYFFNTALLSFLWPKISNLYESNSMLIFNTIKGNARLGIFYIIFSSIIIFFTIDTFFNFMTDGKIISVNYWYVIIFCIFFLIRYIIDLLSTTLQAIGDFRIFKVVLPIQAAFTLLTSYCLYYFESYGVISILVMMMVSYSVSGILYRRQLLSNMKLRT
jgi:O-antigen/teichoic acid export membrane protein